MLSAYLQSEIAPKVNSNRFQIRPVEKQDNKILAHIIREVLDDFDANKPGFAAADPETDNMFETYSNPGTLYLVLVRGEDVVGGAGIGALKGAESPFCELQKMYLLPEARGKGYGRKLINDLLDFAREAGYAYCYLETLSTMESAQNLYRSVGFEELQVPLGNTGHSGCDVAMGLSLKPD